MPEVQTKYPWQSKTILLNGVIALAGFVAMFLPQASVVPAFIQAHAEAIGLFWGVLNIVLRAVTKDAIVLKD